MFTSAVQVRTADGHWRTDLKVGVDYNTLGVDGVSADPAPEIDLVSFADSSINFVVHYWTLSQLQTSASSSNPSYYRDYKSIRSRQFNIPYPIRTLYFYDQQQFNDYFPSCTDQPSNST